MRIETFNGRQLVRDHIFPAEYIKVGSKWAAADGSDHVVTIDHFEDGEVYYSWDGGSHSKDRFSFQTRYCLIVG